MKIFVWTVTLLIAAAANGGQGNLDKKIWAHQAIVATFQIKNSTYIADQKEIAKYFTAPAWKTYLNVLETVNFQQYIEKNNYRVSAVALKPVQLKQLEQGHWQATMPILVQYKNPQQEQLQTLQATIQFKQAPPGQGVRGYQLVSFVSKNIDKPCQCMIAKGKQNL